jgi:hypothetical protein
MSAIHAVRLRAPGVLSGILGLAALAVLGRFAWIHVREELAIAALGSSDEGARMAAARALGELGTLRAIPALLDCARRHDADGDSSRIVDGRNPPHVFDALDEILRPAALPRILRLLDAPAEPDRFWAARALERLDVQTWDGLDRQRWQRSPLSRSWRGPRARRTPGTSFAGEPSSQCAACRASRRFRRPPAICPGRSAGLAARP